MTNIATLTATEIADCVQELGTLPDAPLAMPRQMLERSTRPTLRPLLARLHLIAAPRQEM